MPGALRAALDALLLWLGFFAGWSLVSIPLTLGCGRVEWLWLAFGSGLLGAAGALLTLRKALAPILLPPAKLPLQVGLPRGSRAWLWAGGLAAFALAALAFVPTSDALPLWGITVLLALATLAERNEPVTCRPPAAASRPGAAWAGLVLLGLGIVAVYILVLRPDSDDAFYLNLPIGLLSGQGCMMAADTMHGAADWPLLGSNYRAESLPTLTAAISWLTGFPVITVAHLLLPVVWCGAWACALAVMGHGMFGRHWLVFALLAVLAPMALAGNLQTWGVHGIGRMFHGKAPLILILVPLTVFLVARGSARHGGLVPLLAALSGLCTAAVGLTANAIYLAPLALLAAVVAGQLAWPDGAGRRVVLLAAAAVPVAAGLSLLLFDRPLSASDGGGGAVSADLGFWSMAAQKPTLALLLATIAAAVLAGRTGPGGRWIAAYLAVLMIVAINPLLWAAYDRYVTGGLNFRIWWALPVPTFLAAALTWAAVRSGRPRTGGTVAALGLAAMSLLPSGLIGMEETALRPSIHKVPPQAEPIVREILAVAPEAGTVLAPEAIAAWLPGREGHPALVFSRALYLDQAAALVPPERLAPRRLLAEWVTGAADVPGADLLAAIRDLDVRLIVLPASDGPADADDLLRGVGATRTETPPGYVLWKLPEEAADSEEKGP
ncbi:MAG TPA: DUF6077 domain-containing protein [Paracoccaceae bacterium]|nr:DUF6077 domain-containing protein [Paracoccaceae bacterium]